MLKSLGDMPIVNVVKPKTIKKMLLKSLNLYFRPPIVAVCNCLITDLANEFCHKCLNKTQK